MQSHELACSYLCLHAVTQACMQDHELVCSSFPCLSSSQEFRSPCFKMTISYGQQVATSSGLGVFWKLLFVWKGVRMCKSDNKCFNELIKGSIYKLLWANITVYLVFYGALSFTYRSYLDEHGRVRPYTGWSDGLGLRNKAAVSFFGTCDAPKCFYVTPRLGANFLWVRNTLS